MCGICGYTKYSSQIHQERRISAMLKAIQHRGPDHIGYFERENICLGHARLSVIDLTEDANQPYLLEDRYALVYNGEVYNFNELKKGLANAGFQFQTTSDTEVIISGFAHYGPAFFQRMNGMFALAIYDLHSHQLTLARDRFGIKPLYYSQNEGELLFASEVKGILAYTQRYQFNNNALSEFLYYGNVLGARTMYQDIHQLPPGSYMTLGLDQRYPIITHYWNIDHVKTTNLSDVSSIKEELAFRLENAVKSHLVSDVPISIFLSGGIDSSLVANFAAKHSSEKLTAYTASFEYDKGINEVSNAKKYAESLGIAHHEIKISVNNLPEIVEKLVVAHDSPFSDAANIPLYLMSRVVKEKHKVVLQGDGGDEFYGGYRRYALLSRFNRFKGILPFMKVLTPLLWWNPIRQERVNRILTVLSKSDHGEKMGRLLTAERPDYPPENILTDQFKEEVLSQNPFIAYQRMNQRFSHLDPVQRMLFTDTQVILPNIFCEKVDRSTMLNGVEARVPFLDNQLTEFALSLDASTKMLGGKQKGLLLQAVDNILPQYITRGKKVGFGVPFENWVKGPLKEMFFDYLGSEKVYGSGLYNIQEVERCFKLHEQGKSDKGFLLWKVLNLNIFLNKGGFTF